jgi:hypothetical protein
MDDKSSEIDIWSAIQKLHDCDSESAARGGAFSFYCNSFYNYLDQEIEFFLPQLW